MNTDRKVIHSGTSQQFQYVLSIDSAKSKLFGAFTPLPETLPVTADDIKKAVGTHLHPPEWHDDVLEDVAKALSKGQPVEERRLGRGIEPQPGIPGRFTLLIKPFRGTGQIASSPGGRTNFRELHAFDNVEVGMVVARVFPPRPGVSGKDIYGKEIKADAVKPAAVLTDSSLARRPGTRQDLSYEELVAQRAGVLVEQSGRWSVSEELILREGVDLSIGSVRFVGKVTVQGDVAEGLAVTGKTGVVIHGAARNSVIASTAGDVALKGFQHGCTIRSAGNLSVTVVHNSTLEAEREIVIEREAYHCAIQTGTVIRSARGKIRGGVCRVVYGVDVGSLGSPAGESTEVQLCTPIEVRSAFQELKEKERRISSSVQALELHIGPLLAQRALRARLSSQAQSRLHMLERKLSELRIEAKRVQEEILKSERAGLRPAVSRVSVRDGFYTGVVVRAAECEHRFAEDHRKPATLEFQAEVNKFELVSFREVEAPSDAKGDTKREVKK